MNADRRDLGAIGLLGLAVAAFFWPAVAGGGAFFVQDIMLQNYPFREFFARALAEGELPLWNAAINCGFPLFAEGQAGALYPPNMLLALLLPTWAALSANIALHLWWAGAGLYALMRSLGTVRVAALCAGLCYALGGYMTVRAMSPNYLAVCAWVPVLFLLVERALTWRQGRYLAFFALVVGLQLLAGHPQAAVYGLGAALAYAVFRGWCLGASWGLIAALVVAPALGVGLAAVQLVPTAELVGLSNRGGGLAWADFSAMSLPPERLVTLLLPNVFGNSAHGTYWSRETGFFIQLCAYVGVVPLICAWAALRERRDGLTGFFAALAMAGLVLALGKYTAIFSLLYDIPGLSFFRIPTRFLLWFALGAAVLCGLGIDQVLRPGRTRRTNGVLCAVALALAALGFVYANETPLFGAPVGAAEALTRYVDMVRIDLVRLALALAVGVALLSQRLRVAMWVVPLAIFLELYSFGADFNATIDPAAYTRTPDTAEAIIADKKDAVAPPRVISLVAEKNSPFDWHGGWAYDAESYRRYPETLKMYTGGLYGLANTLPGWSPLHLHRHAEFARGYPGFADLAGIEYAVTYGGGKGRKMELVHEGDIQVYRLADTLPRAYMVGRYRVEAELAGRQAYMEGQRFQHGREVVLEVEPAMAIGAGGRATITDYEDEKVTIALGKHEGGLLVLSDTYYPGWRSFVDGVETEILRANHVFRAVAIPPGAREVVFSYAPDSFRLGGWISAVAALCWLALVVWGRRLAWPLGVGRDPEIGASLKAWSVQATLVAVLHALATQGQAWMVWIERARIGLGG